MINSLFKDFKLPKRDLVTADNTVFQLHYKFTSVLLIVFTIIVTARQYIGDPIHCTSPDKLPQELIDTFCWIHTTYSVNEAWHKEVGEEVIYPGVANTRKNKEENHTLQYHTYYQWICFVLFIQGVLFYAPHYYWRSVIGDKLRNILLSFHNPIMGKEEKAKNQRILSDYLHRSIKNNTNRYLVTFFMAEIANFANVVGQMFLMNKFLNGYFMRYGIDVISFSEWDEAIRYDPMIRVFPRMTKCIYHQFGSSGTISRHDVLCLLPVNIMNEKIYIFLWFWFIILATITGIMIIYHFLCFLLIPMRFITLRARARHIDNTQLKIILSGCHFSDWALLIIMAKNIDPINFKDLMEDLAKRMKEKYPISAV